MTHYFTNHHYTYHLISHYKGYINLQNMICMFLLKVNLISNSKDMNKNYAILCMILKRVKDTAFFGKGPTPKF